SSTSALGVTTSTDLTFADHPSASTLVTAINNVSDWSAVLRIDTLSVWLKPQPAQNAKSMPVRMEYADYDEHVTNVDRDTGVVMLTGRYTHTEPGFGGYESPRFRSGPREVFVDYFAGYETIPAD